MTIEKIIKKLDRLYPQNKAEEWDFVGLTHGDKNTKVKKVLVALDLTTEVLEKAIEVNANLIITHHPFIFNKEDIEGELNEFPYKKDILKSLEQNNIGVFVIHTNFDEASNGMKDATTKLLGLEQIGELSYGVVLKAEHNIDQIKLLIKDKYELDVNCTNVKHNNKFNKIAVLPGSGGTRGLLEAKENGCDLVITGDVKWSTWILAKELCLDLIQISHQMEKVMIYKIASQLEDTEVIKHIEEVI